MKMSNALYSKLKDAFVASPTMLKHGFTKIEEVYLKDFASGAIKAQDIHKRLRWDLWWAIPIKVRSPILRECYDSENLQDDHIDTALKKIVREIKLA